MSSSHPWKFLDLERLDKYLFRAIIAIYVKGFDNCVPYWLFASIRFVLMVIELV